MNTETLVETAPSPAYLFAEKVAYGFVGRLEQEFGAGLKFSPEGLARAAGVCTWLVGLRHGGKTVEEVNALADDFYDNLKYLANYGGTVEVPYRRWICSEGDSGDGHYTESTYEMPQYVVTLYDDATLHGFSVIWRAHLTESQAETAKAKGKEIVQYGHFPSQPYMFSHNGGLIYHGPGRGETFTVSLGDRFWGVHT